MTILKLKKRDTEILKRKKGIRAILKREQQKNQNSEKEHLEHDKTKNETTLTRGETEKRQI